LITGIIVQSVIPLLILYGYYFGGFYFLPLVFSLIDSLLTFSFNAQSNDCHHPNSVV
jgi:hypothetical protein